MLIKNFAGLFAQDGYWRYKRAEKKKLFTDKSMLTRDAVMRNWIVPLRGINNGCKRQRRRTRSGFHGPLGQPRKH